jgi:hypothetical protein
VRHSIENNYNLRGYQSVHADEFKMDKMAEAEADGFNVLDRPDKETDRLALAQADYQTRLRVERANRSKYEK